MMGRKAAGAASATEGSSNAGADAEVPVEAMLKLVVMAVVIARVIVQRPIIISLLSRTPVRNYNCRRRGVCIQL